MLDNRDLATVIVVSGLLALAVLIAPRACANAARAAARPNLLLLVALLGTWVVGLSALATTVRLWDPGLIGPTLIWFALAAVGAAGSVVLSAGAKGPVRWRSVLARLLGPASVISVVLGLSTHSLPTEMAIALLLMFLAAISATGGRASVAADRLIAGIGGLIVLLWIRDMAAGWQTLGTDAARAVLLPLWLGVGFLPALAVLDRYAAYDAAWARVRAGTAPAAPRAAARLAVLRAAVAGGDRRGTLSRVTPGWGRKLGACASVREADAMLRALTTADSGG
jgi:hypothetical protein